MVKATSPLANKQYLKLFSAQVIALFGTGLTTIALALLAYDLAAAEAGYVLGIVLTLKMLAYVVVAPLSTPLLERIPRGKLLVILDLIRAGTVFCLPWVDALWQIYLLVFLLNTCSAVFTPTFQATIPDIIPSEPMYIRAQSLARLAYDLENILSPTIAALLLGFFSYNVLFSYNAIAFLFSAVLVIWAVIPPQKKVTSDDSLWQKVHNGCYIYLHTPRLRGLLALYFAVAAASSMQLVNTVVYVRSVLGLAESEVAITFAAVGLGSIATALILPKLLEHLNTRKVMLFGGFVLTLALGLGSFNPSFIELILLWGLLGIAFSLIQTPSALLLKASCQIEDRPALFTAHFSLSHCCWMVCYPLAGWIGLSYGLSTTFITLSVLCLIATIIAYHLWPKTDNTILIHRHIELEHSHSHSHEDLHHKEVHQHLLSNENTQITTPDTESLHTKNKQSTAALEHDHLHHHPQTTHSHHFVIDRHHRHWPNIEEIKDEDKITRNHTE